MSQWFNERASWFVVLCVVMCLVPRMLAADAAMEGVDDAVAGAGGSTRDSSPPDPIADLVATRSMPDVILMWSIPSDDVGVTSFRVYQHDVESGTCTQIAHILSESAQTYTVRCVCGNPTINFLYDVRAEDAAGNIAGPSNLAGEIDYVGQEGPIGPTIVTTPTCLAVQVLVGSFAGDTLRVSNVGDGVLTISSVTGSDAWLTGEFPTALPVSIQPGASSVLTVNVDAGSLAEGAYPETLFIVSNDPDSPTRDVGILVNVPLVEMKPIPGGTFQMGSTSSWAFPNEQPVHEVTVRAFWMAKYEVTNEQMRAVMQWAYDNGKVTATSTTVRNAEGNAQELLDLDDADCEISFSGGVFTVDAGREDHPCIEVTWYGAQAFCNYLSDMEGLQRCISFTDWSCTWTANGYRLPTEAEWEYACRAGTTTDYYSGDETQGGCTPLDPNLDLIGWYCGNANDWTHAVGQKQQNSFGLYDMSGNVVEWCSDRYGSYSAEPQTDPTGPSTGSYRVDRGGGWYILAGCCRSAFRSNYGPSGSDYFLGFRPARR